MTATGQPRRYASSHNCYGNPEGALTMFLVGVIIVPVCWILGMVLAYQDARAWNRSHGILS